MIEREVQFTISTLYFGGGTPSHVRTKYISNVMNTLSKSFDYDPNETTLEMNPEDVSLKLCSDLKTLGIDRISLGLQTSSDQLLKVIGRPYTFDGFLKAYGIVRNYFKNVNIDMIYGLPFERYEDLIMDLKVIERLEADHISFYELELHDGVPLYSMVQHGLVTLPSEELSERMYDTVSDELEKMGYTRYELSSWTKKKPSLHNLNYWMNGKYIGFGLSAGSHLPMKRWVNTDNIHEYIKAIDNKKFPRSYDVINSKKDELVETLFMGLRLSNGLIISEMRERFGEDFDLYFSKLKRFCPDLLECSDRIRFTRQGMKFSASILSELT